MTILPHAERAALRDAQPVPGPGPHGRCSSDIHNVIQTNRLSGQAQLSVTKAAAAGISFGRSCRAMHTLHSLGREVATAGRT